MFACVPLDGETDHAAGLLFRLQLGFLQNVPRQIGRVPQRFLFNFFQEQPAGLSLAQMGKLLELFLAQPGEPDQFVAFGFDRAFLFFQILLLVAQILFSLNQSFQLSVDQRFPFGQTQFEVSEFAAACAEGFFRLLAEFQGLFIGSEPSLAHNGLGFPVGAFHKRFLLGNACGAKFSLFPPEKPVTQHYARSEEQGAFPE